jgi:hypothetical protein
MATDDAQPTRADELPLFVWATRVVKRGDGRAELVAVKPKKDLSVAEAAQILSVKPRTVRRLWRYGLIDGWKPGAVAERSDSRESNAALVLDAESVLRYKAQKQRSELFS